MCTDPLFPVRAGMVKQAEGYSWSSAAHCGMKAINVLKLKTTGQASWLFAHGIYLVEEIPAVEYHS